MSWITLSATEVREQLTDLEITVIEAAGEDDGTDNDKLTGLIAKVSEQVRGYVGGCERNLPLGAAGTIPSECELSAIAIIRHALSASVPQFPGGDDRVDEYREAIEFLKSVQRCEIAIVASGGDATTPATAEIVSTGSEISDWSM